MPDNKWIDYDFAEHDVRVMCGDHVAVAWEWISTYCKRISGPKWFQVVKPEVLIQTALDNLNKSGSPWSTGNDTMPTLLAAYQTDDLSPRFWDELERLTQTQIPAGKRRGFLYAIY